MLRFLLFFILSCIVINPAMAAGSYCNLIHGSAYAVIPNIFLIYSPMHCKRENKNLIFL